MRIPDYHIRNVLKAYCRQLHRSKSAGKTDQPNGNPFYDRIDIRAREKREAFIRKISATVIERILHDPDLEDAMSGEASGPPPRKKNRDETSPDAARTPPPPEQKGATFIYNRIDEANRKSAHALPLEDLGENPEPPET